MGSESWSVTCAQRFSTQPLSSKMSKKRADNFTPEQCMGLIECVEKRKNVVEYKRTDTAMASRLFIISRNLVFAPETKFLTSKTKFLL